MKPSPSSAVRLEAKSARPFSILALVMILTSASTCLSQESAGVTSNTTTLPVNQLVATVQLGFNFFPVAVVVSPDSKTVYVLSFSPNGGVLSIIDAQSNTITDTVSIPGLADSLVISPDGSTLYAGSLQTTNPPASASVTAVSTATNTITATINLGPDDLVISPNGKKIYATDTVHKAISIVNTATNQVSSDAINTGDACEQIAISRDGKTVYTSNSGSPVSVIDLGTKQVVATIPIKFSGAPAYFATSPAGTRLYIGNGKDVLFVDTSSNTIVHTTFMPVPGAFNFVGGQPGITPDGNFLYEVFPIVNTIVMVDTATKKAAGNQISVGYPQAVTVAPTAAFAYAVGDVTSGNGQEGELYVINISPE
jgi:YVTN family beta-propeller protein